MNNDLISRTELKKCAIPCQLNNGALTDLCVPLYQIDNAPTVEITEEQAIDKLHDTGWLPLHDKEMTERPHGEWIMEENNKDYPDGRATCSCCGYKMDVKRWEWLPAVRWYLKPNYCPECGAEMR